MSPTTQTHPINPFEHESWIPAGFITKKEAARRLDRSESRVAAMAGKEIQSIGRENPQIKQLVTLFHEGDIERILYERKHPPAAVTAVVAKPSKPQLALPAPEPAQPISTRITRPWLTLDEAAEYSGLTKRWLLAQAEDAERQADPGGWPIVIRDMGKHSPGGRWRFHRDCLDKA